MKTPSRSFNIWLSLGITALLTLGGLGAAQAATLTHNAWGTNNSVNCTGYDALQFNATRNPGQGGPPFAGNTLRMLSDVTYWYPNYPCYESTTWTSDGTGRKAAKVSGAYMNPNPTSLDDLYLPIGRFIKLRNLTIDHVDLDYDNMALWFALPDSTPQNVALTLNDGSLTGLNPPSFNVLAPFSLTASGNSTLSDWGKGRVDSQTTLNVTPGSQLTFFRIGQFAGGTIATDSWYFSHPGNVAMINDGTLKLDQSFVTFGQSAFIPGEVLGKLTFQNNALLDIVGEGGRLDSGNIFFINSRLNLGSTNRLKAVDKMTIDGATVTTDDSSKLDTAALDVFGTNTFALGRDLGSNNYTATTGAMVMEPGASLTLNGQGSVAVTLGLDYSFPASGQIIINDQAALVSAGAKFDIRPSSPITINRAGNAVGRLFATNGGSLILRASTADPGQVTNHGQIDVGTDSILQAVGPVIIQGGSEGLLYIGDAGTLMIGNPGTALAATESLTTNNLVEFDNFSELELTLDPTARKSGQLRTGSTLTLTALNELHLSLVNDTVLPDGTKFTLVDYGKLDGDPVPGFAYFKGYPNGSTFVLGLNHYRINYKDTPEPGYNGAITLTVVPAKPLSLAYPTPITANTTGPTQTINPALANLTGTPAYTVLSGALPTGMTLSPTTGVISGIPTTAGPYSATIQLTETGTPGQTTTAALTINVVGDQPTPQLIYPDLLNVPVGSGPYSLAPSTTGFTGPITFSLVDGSLPPGLSLNSTTGVISGTPTTATSGVLTPTISASAQGGVEFIQNLLEIEILPTLAYPPATVTAGSPVNLPPTVSPVMTPGAFTVIGGKLPSGLTLNPSTGVISGIPTAPGSSTVTIQFSTGTGVVQTVTAVLPMTVNANPITFTYPPSTGTIGKPFNVMPTISGTTGAPTFSVYSGQLPAGISLNPATGAITGQPKGPAGTFTVQIMVTDQNTSNIVSVIIAIQAAPPPPNPIPTLGEWGAIIMTMVMLLIGGHRRLFGR